MSFFGVVDALERARQNAGGPPAKKKGTGLTAPGLGLTTSTGQIAGGAVATDPAIALAGGLSTNTQQAAQPKKRGGMSQRLVPPNVLTDTSPVNDKLKATPGTLERAMSQLDSLYAGNPDFIKNREQIKYRLQSVIETSNKNGLPPVLKNDAVEVAQTILKTPGYRRKAAIQAEKDNQPAARVARFDKAREAQTPQQGEGIFDALGRAAEEDRTMVPGLRTPAIDRFLQAVRTIQTPDPTPALEKVAGAPGYVAGKAIHGVAGALNLPAQAAFAGDIADLTANNLGPTEDLPKGKNGKPLTLMQQVAGETTKEQLGFLAELLGGLAGGHLIHAGGEIAGNAIRGGSRPKPVVSDAAPVKAAEPAVPIAPKVEAPEVPTKPKASRTFERRRPNLTQVIDEATAPKPGDSQSLGKSTAHTPDGKTKLPVEFKVVDRSQLNVSHDIEGTANPNYPQFAQPRDRSLPGEKAKIRDQASKLDPGLLVEDFKSTDRGAPLVGSDGVVESGNGRVLSLDQAKRDFPQKYADYQASVRQYASDRGIDISQIKDPVLIQERVGPIDDVTRRQIAGASNEGSSSAMSLAETSRSDVQRLPKDLASRFEPVGRTLEEALASPKNQSIVQGFADALPASERAAMFDGKGGFSEPGRQRVGRAMVSHALGEGSHDVLLRIQQDGDFSGRVSAGLEQSSPSLLRLREAADGGNPVAKGMIDSIVQSLRDVDEAKASGKGSSWFEQGSLMERDPEALRIGSLLHDAKSAKQVAETIGRLADAGTDSGGGMFADEMGFASVKEAVDSVFGNRVIAPDAASPTATRSELGHPTAEKPLFEMTSQELDALREKVRKYEREGQGNPSKFLSAEKLKQFREYENGTLTAGQEMAFFEGLTPSEKRKLFGVGSSSNEYSLADIDEMQRRLEPVRTAESAKELGFWLRNKLHDPERFAPEILSADALIREKGWNAAEVQDAAITGNAASLGNVEDAAFMYRKTVEEAKESIGRTLRFGAQAGRTDVKTLALIGGVGAAGLGLTAYHTAIEKWYRENGLEGVAEAGVVGTAALALVYGASKGKLTLDASPAGFRIAGTLLNPAELARRAIQGGTAVERLFGEGADAILTARAEHAVESARAMQSVGQDATTAFGSKRWLKSKEFLDGDATVRDTMERNIAEGRDWHEGLTPQWKAFVESVIPVLDEVVDNFEDLGGRIRVTNDGTQHLKLKPGDSVRLGGGKYGTYEGFDLPDGGDPTDPFSKNGGFGRRKPQTDVNATPRALRNQRVPGMPSEEVPTLNVRMEDGSMKKIAPGQSFGRPVDRIGQAFVPRSFKDDFVKSIQTLESAPEGFKTALRAMLEDRNRSLGLSGDEMLGQLGDVAGATEATDGGISSFLANLEKERQLELAKFEWVDDKGETHTVDPYESSYITSVSKYLDKGWKRVAIVRQFGPDPSALGGALGIIKARNQAYGTYLEKLTGRVLGIGPERPQSDWLSNLARTEGTYQTLSKLTGGTTQVAQLNDVLYVSTRAGMPTVARAVYDLAFGRDRLAIRADADVMSAVHEQWLSDLHRGASEPGVSAAKVAKFTDAVMTGIGLKAIDKTMKRLAVVAGLRDATNALDIAGKAHSEGKSIPGAVLRKLESYGIADRVELAAATSGEAVMEAPDAMQRFAAATREQLLYSGATEDLPLWMSHPAGAIVGRFKKPLYVSTRFLLHDVVGEMAKGNLKPAVRFLSYGAAGGSLATYLKDVVRAKGMDDETRKMLSEGNYLGGLTRFFGLPAQNMAPAQIAHLVDDKLHGSDSSADLMGILGVAAQNMYDAGGLGVIGEISPMNRRMQDLSGKYEFQPWDAVEPVSLGEVQEWYKRFSTARGRIDGFGSKAPGATDALAEKKQLEYSAALFESLRSSVSPLRRFTDLVNLKPSLTRLRELDRRVSHGGKLSPAEEKTYTDLMRGIEGHFAEIEEAYEDDAGPSYKSQLLKDYDLATSGIPLKRSEAPKKRTVGLKRR